MTTEKEVTCIVCPIGCKILVSTAGTRLGRLQGNKCKKGIEYAINEVFNPRRMLTTSVFVQNGEWPLVSVKSTKPVPKEKIFSVQRELQKMVFDAPVFSAQIIVRNVASTGIDIVATKTIKMKKDKRVSS